MNELIQELSWKAYDSVKNSNPDGWTQSQYNKAFAELIVQECVEVCGGIAAVRAGYNDVDGRDTAYSCGDMIKEHFGVE